MTKQRIAELRELCEKPTILRDHMTCSHALPEALDAIEALQAENHTMRRTLELYQMPAVEKLQSEVARLREALRLLTESLEVGAKSGGITPFGCTEDLAIARKALEDEA